VSNSVQRVLDVFVGLVVLGRNTLKGRVGNGLVHRSTAFVVVGEFEWRMSVLVLEVGLPYCWVRCM